MVESGGWPKGRGERKGKRNRGKERKRKMWKGEKVERKKKEGERKRNGF